MKFEVGKIYLMPGLFIPSYWVKCIKRDEKKNRVFFCEIEHTGVFHKEIEYDLKGNEIVFAWEYGKERGYMNADPA